MSFADFYFKRFNSLHFLVNTEVSKDIKVIVSIPAYDEENILATINNLFEVNKKHKIEIIVVVNFPETATEKQILNNETIFKNLVNFAQKNNCNSVLIPIYVPNIPTKLAGAGYARKIAMDTALWRFNSIGYNGIIASLDADTLVADNYFDEIISFFEKNNFNGANIYFEHIFPNDLEIKKAGILYEIYLRYFIEALRYTGFPYAFHTIGSAFCCSASAYAKTGGMPLKKAGEDFYFLQKLFWLGDFYEINNTFVFPLSRISHRIIFGTGVAIQKIIEKNNSFLTYPFELFEMLKHLFEKIEELYKTLNFSFLETKLLKEYLTKIGLEPKILQLKQNTANYLNFRKRFFQIFNALEIIKFLNYSTQYHYEKKDIFEQTNLLLLKKGIKGTNDSEDLLNLLRKIQKQNQWVIK